MLCSGHLCSAATPEEALELRPCGRLLGKRVVVVDGVDECAARISNRAVPRGWQTIRREGDRRDE